MHETFIAFLWFNRLFDRRQTTLLGQQVDVLAVGLPNSDAGPDAFNAVIRIDGQRWAGNVEFHLRASDWHRHHHDHDPNYQNIILHVVLDADEQLFVDERPIPTICLSYPDIIRQNYDALILGERPCETRLSTLAPIQITAWQERLVVERLETKADNVARLMQTYVNDWSQAIYTVLARSFGRNVNAEAMQQLAQTVPLRILRHHTDRPEQIRALLLGQAGVLPRMPESDETELYRREYSFLSHKYSLPRPMTTFRFARMRPQNFPTRRIIQFADRVPHIPSIDDLVHHGHICPDTLDLLTPAEIINCYLPCIYRYAEARNLPELAAEVVDRLHSMPPENNTITRHFATLGLPAADAAQSQALIQLHRLYCEPGDCLRCRLARMIMRG